MKQVGIFLLLVVGFVTFSAFMPEGKGTKAPRIKTYFACKQFGKIMLSSEQFIEYIAQPLCARDSLDSTYAIKSFDVLYAETGLYQDSAGLPLVMTDYSYASFKGNRVDTGWVNVFRQQAYKGDTIRISNILVKGADKRTYRSSNIELVIR